MMAKKDHHLIDYNAKSKEIGIAKLPKILAFSTQEEFCLRIFNLEEMNRENINLQNITVVSVREPRGRVGIFSATKRKTSVLCFYAQGKRRYSFQDDEGKKQFDLSSGDILYIPQESAYRFEILETGEEELDAMIAIHFRMVDEKGETVNFGNHPRVLTKDKLDHYFALFRRIESTCAAGQGNSFLIKSFIYGLLHEIISQLYAEETRLHPYAVILPAVFAMQADPASDLPIPFLAQMCGVSQTRFRQLFGAYTGGLSPVEYRNKLRIERVEELLYTGEVTVDAAAFRAGFRDQSHFYRILRKYKGKLPSQYK